MEFKLNLNSDEAKILLDCLGDKKLSEEEAIKRYESFHDGKGSDVGRNLIKGIKARIAIIDQLSDEIETSLRRL